MGKRIEKQHIKTDTRIEHMNSALLNKFNF